MTHYCPAYSFAISEPRPKKRRSGKGEDKPVSLDVFVSQVYLPYAKQYKKSWAMDERIARQHISPIFGDRAPAEINRKDVEAWLQGLAEKGLAPATCNRILYVFKSICSLAVRHDLFPSGNSPCVGVSPFKVCTLRERYLTAKEARRLMEELDRSQHPEAKAIKLLLLTGGRKSEILKAQWVHIHLEQRLLTVPESKSGKPRHIPLSDEAIAVIQSIPRVPGCPWLFPGRVPGKPLSDIYLFWNKLRRKLGLQGVRIHDLRHTFASMLVNAGLSLYSVQKLLGHSDPRTTMRYAHLGQASLLAAAQTVGALLARSHQNSNGRPQPMPPHSTCSGTNRASPYAPVGV